MRIGWLVLSLSLLPACERRPAPVSAQTGATFTADSTRQAQLRRFREGLPEVEELQDGAPGLDHLVQAYLAALEARDTTALKSLTLSRSEFAWVYYPTNPQARPPYDLEPGLLWFMTGQHSGKGLGRALETFGGKPMHYAGTSCDRTASKEGENTVYGPCLVRLVQSRGDTTQIRMFGLVIERHGRWKFVSYANKLD
jgi:hypothetical protein